MTYLIFFGVEGGLKRNAHIGDPQPHSGFACSLDSLENLISLQTYDVDRMLGQRRRQWASIKPMFSLCIVFAGNVSL